MPKFEYLVERPVALHNRYLNERGNAGWELVSIHADPPGMRARWTCVFLREKRDAEARN